MAYEFQNFQQFAGQNLPNRDDFRNFSDLYNLVNQGSQAQGAQLQRGAEQLFRSRAEGIGASFSEFQRGLGSSLSAQGVNPAFAQRMIAEQGGVVPREIAAARGESQFQLSQGLAGILGQQTESLVSLGLNAKQMALGEYLAAKARREARKNRITGAISGALGLGILGGFNPFGFFSGLGGGGGGAAAGAAGPGTPFYTGGIR